jgi:hypothetical protein
MTIEWTLDDNFWITGMVFWTVKPTPLWFWEVA